MSPLSSQAGTRLTRRCRPLNNRGWPLSTGAITQSLMSRTRPRSQRPHPDGRQPDHLRPAGKHWTILEQSDRKEDNEFFFWCVCPYHRRAQLTLDKSYWSAGPRDEPKYASQQTLYDDLGVDLLDHSFEGFNTCIFACELVHHVRARAGDQMGRREGEPASE